MLDNLVSWIREEQLKTRQSIFDAPPKTMEDLRERLAVERTFNDVLEKIDRIHRADEERESTQ